MQAALYLSYMVITVKLLLYSINCREKQVKLFLGYYAPLS